MKLLALALTIVCIFSFFDLTYCENGSLPQELLEIAKKNGFREVTGFYDRPGMINPPYTYGYLTCDKEDSAAFWCENQQKGKTIYYLMIMVKENKCGKLKCSDKIEWHNYPKGLSIYKSRDGTLENFFYLSDPKRKPPKTEKIKHDAILSEYDGVEELFYCYEGEWVVRIRH
jgi:hypothetical protein